MPVSICQRTRRIVCVVALATAAPTPAVAQRPTPLVGTVSPNAIGPAAPTAVPIGGLRTRPLSSPTNAAIAPRQAGHLRFAVADAPRSQAGVVVATGTTGRRSDLPMPTWLPTAERPRWIPDPRVTPVQAWRDLLVTDVVCNGLGTCLERQQAIRARWIGGCRCYAFADGWNRVWRVE
ncbi:MAG: hypothetical protein IPP90_19755 [Gemmatimonadaceae bacterium]|nr:hypothetical protein [Gemmatimonadaceae bacterium]